MSATFAIQSFDDLLVVLGIVEAATALLAAIYFVRLIFGHAEPLVRHVAWNSRHRVTEVLATHHRKAWWATSISQASWMYPAAISVARHCRGAALVNQLPISSQFASGRGTTGAKLLASTTAIIGTLQVTIADQVCQP
jgi:hypothetical protein